jgi:hypothetical protein
VNNLRGDKSVEHPLLKKLHSRYLGIPYHIGQNYLLSFSPSFLFDKGGEKLVHNLNGFGNLYIFDALLLALGFIGICYMRERFGVFLFMWLIIAPIPNALTLDSPNSTRLFILLPVLILLEAYGAYMILKAFEKGIKKIILILLILLYILNFIFFLDSYCIPIAIKKNISQSLVKIYASDVSKKALLVAKGNAIKHRAPIRFYEDDLLTKPRDEYDLIIANLPYGWNKWKNNSSMATRGLQFEPAIALFTEKNGLALIEKLLKQIFKLTQKPKVVLLEFDPHPSGGRDPEVFCT